MSLFSLSFFVFFIVVIILLRFATSARRQAIIIMVASMLFYAAWDWRFLTIIVADIVAIYLAGIKCRESKVAYYTGCAIPLLFLCVCKYLNFFIDNFCLLVGTDSSWSIQIILPLGISFYSFLAISYVADVRNGKLDAMKDIIPLAAYILFFPCLMSGPITKARDMVGQFQEYHPIEFSNLQIGAQLFVVGCLKKYVLADNLGVFVDEVYRTPLAFDSVTVWLAVVSFSLQLYFDFSGYSDMAIGCGRAMGYKLSENFNMPYLSRSISEFWKRWHISLSSWIMEYCYIPLGGNRCTEWKVYRNLLLTMIICGIWHGAAWTFVLWGGIHGVLLCFHKYYKNTFGAKINTPDAIKIPLTFLLVTFCWIFFRGDNLSNIGQIFSKLILCDSIGVNHMYIYSFVSLALLLASIVYSIWKNNWQGYQMIVDISQPKGLFIFSLEILLLWSLMYTGNNPFSYAAF